MLVKHYVHFIFYSSIHFSVAIMILVKTWPLSGSTLKTPWWLTPNSLCFIFFHGRNDSWTCNNIIRGTENWYSCHCNIQQWCTFTSKKTPSYVSRLLHISMASSMTSVLSLPAKVLWTCNVIIDHLLLNSVQTLCIICLCVSMCAGVFQSFFVLGLKNF